MVRAARGNTITVTPKSYYRVGNAAYRTLNIPEGTALTVTRSNEETVLARGPLLVNGRDATVDVPRADILTVNGIDVQTGQPAVPARPLGQKPDDTPEMTYIGTDHPGIQWLFDDMAKFAENKMWCSQYEDLAGKLGIPGREDEYELSASRNGIIVVATVPARSLAEAEAKLRAVLITAE